jgi:pimeloyl-ACP methyl ester carboxylesterase
MPISSRDGFLEIDGVRLETRWISGSSPNAPTLVFLHEALGSISLWRDFPQRLAAATGCGALVYSRQGYGRSDPITLPRSGDYHRDEGLRVLPKIIELAGIETFVLIGHSDGASIAIVYSGAVTDDGMLGTILEAPHVFVEDKNVDAIRRIYERWETGRLRQRLKRHHGENVDRAFFGWAEAWLDPEFRTFNLEPFLPRITRPVMIIQGKEDEYGTAQHCRTMVEQVPGPCEVVLLPDCRHSPHLDQRDRTLQAMARFIERLRE